MDIINRLDRFLLYDEDLTEEEIKYIDALWEATPAQIAVVGLSVSLTSKALSVAFKKIPKWLNQCERKCDNAPFGQVSECKEKCQKKAHEAKRKLQMKRDKK